MRDNEGTQFEVEIEIKNIRYFQRIKPEEYLYWISKMWKNALVLWKVA